MISIHDPGSLDLLEILEGTPWRMIQSQNKDDPWGFYRLRSVSAAILSPRLAPADVLSEGGLLQGDPATGHFYAVRQKGELVFLGTCPECRVEALSLGFTLG